MANQFAKGHTFVPNEVVDPVDLNNLVDLASGLPAMITDSSHAVVNATSGDMALLVRSGALKQADVDTFPQGVTDINVTATPTLVFLVSNDHHAVANINIAMRDQLPNKVLASSAIPGGSVTPMGARVLVPADLPMGTALVSAGIIDCTLSNTFLKMLPVGNAGLTLTINNMFNGQTIRVGINNNAVGNNTVNWVSSSGTLIWRKGPPPGVVIPPVVTQIGNAKDIFIFTKIDVAVYGYADQNFQV